MDEEEKGFVIKDKRSFDDEGELREKKQNAPVKEPEIEKKEAKETLDEEPAMGPLPEVNFNSLIFSLSSSVLLHLGEIEDPQTGEKRKDLAIAKHSIDTIAMLKEKTQGNLDDEEAKFIENILTDLRWRYVKATE